MYLSFVDYKEMGGTVTAEAAFILRERQARALVDYYTFGRIKEISNQEVKIKERIKECVFDLIEFAERIKKASEEGSKVIQSEKVGEHSVTYADGLGLLGLQTGANYGRDREQLERDIIIKHLMGTGLMYRGIDDDY